DGDPATVRRGPYTGGGRYAACRQQDLQWDTLHMETRVAPSVLLVFAHACSARTDLQIGRSRDSQIHRRSVCLVVDSESIGLPRRVTAGPQAVQTPLRDRTELPGAVVTDAGQPRRIDQHAVASEGRLERLISKALMDSVECEPD